MDAAALALSHESQAPGQWLSAAGSLMKSKPEVASLSAAACRCLQPVGAAGSSQHPHRSEGKLFFSQQQRGFFGLHTPDIHHTKKRTHD
ncbi:hypothetical protein NQZ68_030136 [Dissostichus eleginoides]|nr:hypothetical protein NQZ68_030136 [Dissostichus eleginoides]